MAITLKVENEMTMLADIERVRGNLTPGDFIVKCISDAVRLADLERLKKAETGKPGVLDLGQVAPEFANVDRETVVGIAGKISEQLKQAKENNPIYAELGRLIANYTALIAARRKETGRPIGKIEGIALAPIQQVALEAALYSVQKESGGTITTATKH